MDPLLATPRTLIRTLVAATPGSGTPLAESSAGDGDINATTTSPLAAPGNEHSPASGTDTVLGSTAASTSNGSGSGGVGDTQRPSTSTPRSLIRGLLRGTAALSPAVGDKRSRSDMAMPEAADNDDDDNNNNIVAASTNEPLAKRVASPLTAIQQPTSSKRMSIFNLDTSPEQAKSGSAIALLQVDDDQIEQDTATTTTTTSANLDVDEEEIVLDTDDDVEPIDASDADDPFAYDDDDDDDDGDEQDNDDDDNDDDDNSTSSDVDQESITATAESYSFLQQTDDAEVGMLSPSSDTDAMRQAILDVMADKADPIFGDEIDRMLAAPNSPITSNTTRTPPTPPTTPSKTGATTMSIATPIVQATPRVANRARIATSSASTTRRTSTTTSSNTVGGSSNLRGASTQRQAAKPTDISTIPLRNMKEVFHKYAKAPLSSEAVKTLARKYERLCRSLQAHVRACVCVCVCGSLALAN
jgi:hypothetical protein